MAISSFTPPPVPFDASPGVRQYLDEQMRRLQVLVNGAAQRAEAETISGAWTFDANTAFTGNIHLTGAGGYISFDSTTGNAANRITGNAHNSVADDASIQVPFGGGQTAGFVMVWTSSSVGEWFFGFLNPSGALTAIAQGINTSSGDTNPDVDGSINVYKDGAGIGVKNRRGANRHIRVMLFGT